MKLVIFDIDGTLVNSMKVDDVCYFDTFRDLYDITIDDSKFPEYKDITSGTDLGLFRHIFKEFMHSDAALKDTYQFKTHFINKLQNEYDSNPQLFSEIDGARAMIEKLSQHPEINLAIATGCWSDSAIIKLKAIGLDVNQFPISTSDVYPNRKDILMNAMNLSEEFYSSNGYEKIIYIGDGAWDYKASKLVNIDFIGMDFHKTNMLKELGAESIIHNYTENTLLNFLGIE